MSSSGRSGSATCSRRCRRCARGRGARTARPAGARGARRTRRRAAGLRRARRARRPQDAGDLPAAAAGCDMAVNLHGRGPQSHRALRGLRPGRLVAFAAEGHDGPPWREDEHEVRRWCRLLEQHGIAADPGDLSLRPRMLAQPPRARRDIAIPAPLRALGAGPFTAGRQSSRPSSPQAGVAFWQARRGRAGPAAGRNRRTSTTPFSPAGPRSPSWPPRSRRPTGWSAATRAWRTWRRRWARRRSCCSVRPRPRAGARRASARSTACCGQAAPATRTQRSPIPACSRSRRRWSSTSWRP